MIIFPPVFAVVGSVRRKNSNCDPLIQSGGIHRFSARIQQYRKYGKPPVFNFRRACREGYDSAFVGHNRSGINDRCFAHGTDVRRKIRIFGGTVIISRIHDIDGEYLIIVDVIFDDDGDNGAFFITGLFFVFFELRKHRAVFSCMTVNNRILVSEIWGIAAVQEDTARIVVFFCVGVRQIVAVV